jgi:hypothetical protein
MLLELSLKNNIEKVVEKEYMDDGSVKNIFNFNKTYFDFLKLI